MINMLKKLVREEEGQTMVEYGLVIAGVAVVVIVIVKMLKMDLPMLIGTALDSVGKMIEDLDTN